MRRLGEYRRKFNEDAPSKPRGIMSGTIGSPIGSQVVSKMTDEQWLKAMAKHNTDDTDWGTLTGGARELSHVLRDQVKSDPDRYARLALRLTPDLNAAYADGFLMGFADVERSDATAELIYEAVRHIATLGHSDIDR